MHYPIAPSSRNTSSFVVPDYINKEIYYCTIETGAPIYSTDQKMLGYVGRYSYRPNDVTSGAREIVFNLNDIERGPSKALRGLVLYEYEGNEGKGYMVDNHIIE